MLRMLAKEMVSSTGSWGSGMLVLMHRTAGVYWGTVVPSRNRAAYTLMSVHMARNVLMLVVGCVGSPKVSIETA